MDRSLSAGSTRRIPRRQGYSPVSLAIPFFRSQIAKNLTATTALGKLLEAHPDLVNDLSTVPHLQHVAVQLVWLYTKLHHLALSKRKKIEGTVLVYFVC